MSALCMHFALGKVTTSTNCPYCAYESRIAVLQSKLDEANRIIEQQKALIEKLQWIQIELPDGLHVYCPECLRYEIAGHEETCEILKALTQLSETTK